MNYFLKKTTRCFVQMCTTLLMFFILTSCSDQVSLENLYGTYIADYKVASEQLTLNKDGTFLQKVTLKSNQKVDIAKGTWRYDLEMQGLVLDNNFLVPVNGFMEFNPNYLQPKKGIAALPTGIFLGKIRIGSSEGVLYRKIDKE